MKSLSERKIAIIGRGIAGLAIAYRLLQKGLSCTLFGLEEDMASRCAQGIVGNKGLVFFESPLFAAKLQSLSHAQLWLDELEEASGQAIDRRFEGVDEPYWDDNDFQALISRIYRRRFLACHRVQNRSYPDGPRWPFMTAKPAGYLFHPADGWFDVGQTLAALSVLLERGGVSCMREKVRRVVLNAEGTLDLQLDSNASFSFDQVILAGGAGTPDLLAPLVPRLPKMFAIGGQTLSTEVAIESEIARSQVRKTLSVNWWRKRLVIGASSWKGATIGAKELAEDASLLLATVAENFGWPIDAFPLACWSPRVGVRLRFADRMPAIGSLPHEALRDKVFLATGFYKNGLQLADLCARDLLARIEHKPALFPDFCPSRLFSN